MNTLLRIICLVVLMFAFAAVPLASIAEDETGCVWITGSGGSMDGLRDSRVTVQYQDARGEWHHLASKIVGKLDKKVKICGLKPGMNYRVIGRKENDDNKGLWQYFIFNPDPVTNIMKIEISIKMR